MSRVPTGIKVRTQSRCVEFSYADQQTFQLSFEYLRVYSPSAEVRGHGVGNEILQIEKQDVGLLRIEPAGNYALKFVFDDGHDSGLYDWEYLYRLATEHDILWPQYLEKLQQAGQQRKSQNIRMRPLND